MVSEKLVGDGAYWETGAMKSRKWILKVILVMLGIVSVLTGLFLFWRSQGEFVHASYPSPDGRFRVEVIEYPQLLGHMPGDSGSGSGRVQLVDQRSGRILHRKSVDPVLVIDTVRWSPDSVDIKLFAEWPLP